MIQFQLLHCPLIHLCVAFCQTNLCLFWSLREMSCTKQHVSECMNHFRCLNVCSRWRLNKHIRVLGGCSTQTPPLSVCVMFKDRHVNCRGRIRLHIPDKSKLFFLAFTDRRFLADYGEVHHHYSDRHINQSCSFSSSSGICEDSSISRSNSEQYSSRMSCSLSASRLSLKLHKLLICELHVQ